MSFDVNGFTKPTADEEQALEHYKRSGTIIPGYASVIAAHLGGADE